MATTTTDISSFTPAQQAAFNNAANLAPAGSVKTITNNTPNATGSASAPLTNSPTGSTYAPAGSAPTPGGNNTSNYTAQNGQTYNSVGQPLLSANVASPISYGSSPAPAVFNSKAAEAHLDNISQQATNLNNDAVTQSQSNAGGQQPGQTSQQDNTQPAPQNSSTQSNSDDPAAALDEQINSILSNLGQGESNLTDQAANATTTNNEGQQVTFAQAQQENQMQQAQSYQQYAGLLDQIQRGTYPLSAPEQQLLSSTQSQFMQAIQAQQTANTAFTGQMTEAMASLGINTSAPTQAMGNIFGAISTGQSKIADLDTQMAQSVANLQLGFQKQDFDQVQQEWDNMSKQFSDRQSSLATMQKSVTDAITQQKSELVDMAKMGIDAVNNSANLSYKEKQDAISNALNQAQFTESQKKDAQDYAMQAATLQLKQRAQSLDEKKEAFTENQTNNAGSFGTNAPTVAMNGDGTVNKAQQSAFLAGVPPGVASTIQGIANYTINPASFSTSAKQAQGGLTRGELVSLASQYDPSYSESNYANRQALVKNFTSGDYSQSVTALNTAVGHIADLSDNFSKLDNAGFTPYNTAKNTLASLFGSGEPSRAELNIEAATGELATAFKKSGATDSEIKALGVLNSNSSPDQVKSYQEAASQLLASKLAALESTYTSGMGKAPDKGFLSDTSSNALLQLQQQGLNIKVPELAKTPVIQIQTFHDADPKNAQLVDQIMQANPNYSPADVVSLLQNQGILQ